MNEQKLYVKYRAILSPLEDDSPSAPYAAGRFVLGPEFLIGASGTMAECVGWVSQFINQVRPPEVKNIANLEIHGDLASMMCPDWLYDMGYEPWIIINKEQ